MTSHCILFATLVSMFAWTSSLNAFAGLISATFHFNWQSLSFEPDWNIRDTKGSERKKNKKEIAVCLMRKNIITGLIENGFLRFYQFFIENEFWLNSFTDNLIGNFLLSTPKTKLKMKNCFNLFEKLHLLVSDLRYCLKDYRVSNYSSSCYPRYSFVVKLSVYCWLFLEVSRGGQWKSKKQSITKWLVLLLLKKVRN